MRHLIRGAFDLWPLILIVIGISIIFKKELLNTLLWVFFVVVVVVYSLFMKDDILKKNNRFINNSSKSGYNLETNTIDMDETIEKAKLHLDIGAVSFNVNSTDEHFINLDQDGSFDLNIDSRDALDHVYITNEIAFRKGIKASKFNVDINENTPWDFDIDMGAGSGYLNLKEIMVEKMDIDMGAGEIEIDFGNKLGSTYVDVDAGASKITINIPGDVGVKIDFEGALSSTNFDDLGLIKSESGKYISENYEAAGTRYEIDVDMGVGSFDISYY